jgi:hypothetical protein
MVCTATKSAYTKYVWYLSSFATVPIIVLFAYISKQLKTNQ